MADRVTRAELKEGIREAARELGFHQAGFAPAEAPAHGEWYREWLERGWHGELAYMARDDAVRRRLSPAEALPGCRSLVVVSVSYATPDDLVGEGAVPDRARGGAEPTHPRPAGNDPTVEDSPVDPPVSWPGSSPPLVARYASGNRDYHLLFEERLTALGERISEMAPDSRVKPYVDYGPVLERDHAQRAGLGWIGKNTMLIHPEHGSYLLLGELLTTLDLPPDEAFVEDRCGSCRRCIEACPTDAIRGGRMLDARRCISYLTIELEGSIPEELRALVGNRVFGCDICQEACPWNREVSGGPDPGLPLGRPVEPATMVRWTEELLGLDGESFRRRYGDTPYERPGREGMLRNLCVGLGNSAGREAVPVLLRALAEGSTVVREHARWALGRLGERIGPGTELSAPRGPGGADAAARSRRS